MHCRKTRRVGSLCTMLWTKRDEQEKGEWELPPQRARTQHEPSPVFLSTAWALSSSPWARIAALGQVGRVRSYCSLGMALLSLRKAGFVKKSLEHVLKLHHLVGSTALEHIFIFNPFIAKQVFSSFKHNIWTYIRFLSITCFFLLFAWNHSEFPGTKSYFLSENWVSKHLRWQHCQFSAIFVHCPVLQRMCISLFGGNAFDFRGEAVVHLKRRRDPGNADWQSPNRHV